MYFTALVGEERLIGVVVYGNKAKYFFSTTELTEIRAEEALSIASYDENQLEQVLCYK